MTRKLLSTFLVFNINRMPFYAVAKGRSVGIYENWTDCESQVKGFPGARFKKFNTTDDAAAFIRTYSNQGNHCITNNTQGLPEVRKNSKRPSSVLSSKNINGSESTKKAKNFNENELSNLDIVEELKNIESRVNLITDRLGQNASAKISVQDKGTFEKDSDGFVQVYTDGACSSNGGSHPKAGIGVFWSPGHPLNTSKPVKGRATNNCGEIQAASCAIKHALENDIKKLKINTDSQFLINAVTKWIKGWKRNCWKLKSGQDVKNVSDFKELDNLLQGPILVKWNYVKAHQGILGNEMADQLAKAGAASYL